jgi:hypothetical protein
MSRSFLNSGTLIVIFRFAALEGPVQIIFFLTIHYFNSFAPIAQQAGQAAVLGRLSLGMYLCVTYSQLE